MQVVTAERSVLVVPERAVLQSGERTIVYVLGDDRKAQPRPVELGMRQSGVVEIMAGLAEGDEVITEGVIKMRPGLQVRVAGDRGERHAEARGERPGSGQPVDRR